MNSLGGAEYKVPDNQLKSENKIRGIHGYVVIVVIALTTTFNQPNYCWFLFLQGSFMCFLIELGPVQRKTYLLLFLSGSFFLSNGENRFSQLYSCSTSLSPIFPLGLRAKTGKKRAATWRSLFFDLINSKAFHRHSVLAEMSHDHTLVCTKFSEWTICFIIT